MLHLPTICSIYPNPIHYLGGGSRWECQTPHCTSPTTFWIYTHGHRPYHKPYETKQQSTPPKPPHTQQIRCQEGFGDVSIGCVHFGVRERPPRGCQCLRLALIDPVVQLAHLEVPLELLGCSHSTEKTGFWVGKTELTWVEGPNSTNPYQNSTNPYQPVPTPTNLLLVS